MILIYVCAVSLNLWKGSFSVSLIHLIWFSGLKILHINRHSWDLVLSHGFSITDVQVFDTLLSDHMPVLFTLPFSQLSLSITPTEQLPRSFSSHFCDDFTNTFNKVCLSLSLESFLPDLDAEQHLSLFNTACSEVINTTAPLKPKKSKPKTEQ